TLAALRNGGGTVTLNNKKARVYSAEKQWNIPQDNYKPEAVSAVLQHKNGAVWETVETVTLSEENGWKADFSPIPETAGMDADYRVRELDPDGNPVLDAADEGGTQQPSVTFRIEPWTDTYMDMTYRVSYTAAGSGKTVIINTAGEYYYVKIIWQSNNGVVDTPEKVTVNLFKNGSVADSIEVSAESNWEGVFAGQMDTADYRAREKDSDDKTVFVSNLDSEAFPGCDYDKAVYIVEKDGAQRIYEFDVTVEVSNGGRTTVITNTKSGVVFTAKKVWNAPDDSMWPQRIYRVYAVLQQLVTPEGEDAEPVWQDVERIGLSADSRWEDKFAAVPVGQDFDEDNYRVREFIENVKYWTYSNLKIEAGTDDPDAEGRLMLLLDDSDNTDRKEPHFNCQYRYIDGSMSDYEYSSVGFTVSYERDKDGTFVIVNTQDGVVTVEKKWTDGDGKAITDGIPESVKVVLQKKVDGEWTTVGEAAILNKENGWKKSFDLTGELDPNDISAGLANYRVRELDEDGNIVYDADDSDKPEDVKGKISFKVKTGEDDKTADVYFEASYRTGSAGGTYTVTNKLLGGRFVIEKEWDIDLEKTDCPDSVEAVIQAKNGDEWETVKLIELKGKEEDSENNSGNNPGDGNNSGNGNNSERDTENEEWKVTVYLPLTKKNDDDKTEKIEYRVRELREETALDELMGRLKDFIKQGKDKYDEWIETLKTEGSQYFDLLPDPIKEAANQGYEQLLDKLNATPNDLYDKLMEKLDEVTSGNRIVYDKDDPEVKKDDDGKGGDDNDGDDEDDKPETNAVRFHVKEKNSVVSGGKVDAHVTKYSVEYKEEDGTFTITNKAILEIDLIKRWLAVGVDEEDMPDSAWVVLLFKPKKDALSNASGIASSAGVDISGVLDFEFPVINPEDGGRDPVSIISELVAGIDINIFSSLEIVPKLAIDKVDEDSDWKKTYTVSKYYCGIPMEYKGAELSSEIIRQIVKYLTNGVVDSPVSYNPFDNYFSIPTPAIRTLAGITDPSDFLDFSALAGKFLEKAKSLTMDDIKNFGPETLLDDWHLMANVINVKIDWNTNPGKPGLVIVNNAGNGETGSNFIFEIEQIAKPENEDGDKSGDEDDEDDENEQTKPFGKLTVVIAGSGSVRIADIPEGVYRVTELTDWSWRYDATSEVSVEVTVEGEDDATVTFTNALNGKNWLNAETRADNRLGEYTEHETPGQSKTGGTETRRTVRQIILEQEA
ncbi:MAG: Cna B-type domain-containing protein, partial [Clostridia bacterium]|nr:Cna B-type domain-containing protein [Clostridia bacterium]